MTGPGTGVEMAVAVTEPGTGVEMAVAGGHRMRWPYMGTLDTMAVHGTWVAMLQKGQRMVMLAGDERVTSRRAAESVGTQSKEPTRARVRLI